MLKIHPIALLILLLMLLFVGCRQSESPAIPAPNPQDSANEITVSSDPGSRTVLGVFNVFIDPENLEATVEPAPRDASHHWDVTGIFYPPYCDDCLQIIINGWNPESRIADVSIKIENPTQVVVFDLRTVFQDYDLKEFIDIDGYTDLWNSESERNPFYCFVKENPNRIFGAFQTHYRDFEVHVPVGATGFVTIIVDVSWPEQAPEPYEVRTAVSSWLINDGTDNTKIVAYVSDHQEDIEYVTADLSPIGGTTVTMYDDGSHGDGDLGDGIFAIQNLVTTVPHGIYDIWVSCKSTGSDILAFQKAIITVSDIDPYRGDPDYGRVYDTSQVKRIDIFISGENWEAMQQDLDEQIELPWDVRDFKYFECEVLFENNVWQHVGIRYKGNSSIQMPYQQNREKLPFRLDFDEFEEFYPEIDNQRFWGFKWMVFNNNFKDPSMLREIITYDLFREFGAVASHAAHYRLFIDFGEGPVYFGLYTSVEVVDDRFLDDRFGTDNGNLYKPEGPGDNLTSFNEDTFEKKTNEDEADWSDVINLIQVLNDNYPNPDDFKAAIDQIFDVNSFLSWLAVNSVMCNLDSYAGTGHNYYLYNNPVDGKFYLIPWDCNESFGSFLGSMNADNMHTWDILSPTDQSPKPLIENILDVPEYMDDYRYRVRSLLDGLLDESAIYNRIDTYHLQARPYVIGPDGEFIPYTLLMHQDDFDINIDFDVPPFGPNRTLGLKPFLANRRAYIDTIIP